MKYYNGSVSWIGLRLKKPSKEVAKDNTESSLGNCFGERRLGSKVDGKSVGTRKCFILYLNQVFKSTCIIKLVICKF